MGCFFAFIQGKILYIVQKNEGNTTYCVYSQSENLNQYDLIEERDKYGANAFKKTAAGRRHMMRRLRWLIYVQPLGRIVCFMVLLILIWGFLGSRCARQKWWRILNFIIFLCGLAAVIYLTIGTRETNTQEIILIRLLPNH